MGTVQKNFHKGDVIIKEGHHGSSFYVISSGSVEVVKRRGEGEVRLSVLEPGDFFGEMSLLDPGHNIHSASVRALEESVVTIMSEEDFESYLGHLTPGMRNLLRKLSRRLRETDEKLASLAGRDIPNQPAVPAQPVADAAKNEKEPEP